MIAELNIMRFSDYFGFKLSENGNIFLQLRTFVVIKPSHITDLTLR